jgi:ATP-dependent phosphoenolpyruvate carboxykinase
VAELYEYAMQPEHIGSINPHVFNTTISDAGALTVSSGQKTGRTPKEKRIVHDDTTKNVIKYHRWQKLIPNIDHMVGQCQHSY